MPEHTMEALIMRVTPQANIMDSSGTTIPAKTAVEARKVLIQTARLQGGSINAQQLGYDPSHPTAGTTVTIHADGRIEDRADPGSPAGWRVAYHSWSIDVDGEPSYIVPGVPTALSDARMLATRRGRPVSVQVLDIKPDGQDARDYIEPEPTPVPVPLAEPTVEPKALDDVHAQADAPKNIPVPLQLEDPEATAPGVGASDQRPSEVAAKPRRGRRVLLVSLAAAVLIAGGAATTTVLSVWAATAVPTPTTTSQATLSPLWNVAAAPRDNTLAAHGVLVTAGGGKGEAFSLDDGKPVGTAALPEGRPRVVAGTDAVFAVVAGKDGTSSGFVSKEAGVKDFSGIKGTLVVRGAEPFFLTGSGKYQGALVWDGTTWKPVQAPEAGMAPVAASKAGVLWLGTNSRLVLGSTSASLAEPEAESKISGWIWADEKSVVVLWDTPNGKVLAAHTIADGKITGKAPAGDGEVRKDGALIVSGATVFSLQSGTPVPSQDCADPVPSGGMLWCRTENTWAAHDARPLAPGESPVPSPADLVVTATDSGFTAYSGDEMKSDQTHEEK